MTAALWLLVYALASFGFAFIVGWSKISLPFRMWLGARNQLAVVWLLALVECPACLSTWTGFAAGAWAWKHGLTAPLGWFTSMWVAGLFTCASSLILARVVGLSYEEEQ